MYKKYVYIIFDFVDHSNNYSQGLIHLYVYLSREYRLYISLMNAISPKCTSIAIRHVHARPLRVSYLLASVPSEICIDLEKVRSI